MNKNTAQKRDILQYVGNNSQLFGVKDYNLNGGKAAGVRAVDVKNGSGLEFTVLPDRGLDIACLSFKSTNFSYMSNTGITSAHYFNEKGLGFLRSFYAGFLTTCGLTYVGAPCVDNDEELGLHGRISNTPAEEVYAGTEWVDDLPVMRVAGKMREARLFGENIQLEREIITKYGSNKILINDRVENYGFEETPLMLLYHFNLGYPLLDENSYLLINSNDIKNKNSEAEEAEKEIESCCAMQRPTKGYKEQVFYHNVKGDNEGNVFAALINRELELGVVVRFNKNQLCNFTQWKQMGEGEYVLGMEPCNCHVEGRAKDRSNGTLETIKPGEVRKFNIEVEILEGMERIRQLEGTLL